MTSRAPDPSWKSYLRWMLATCLLVISLTGLLNILIDPLGVFDSPRISGINSVKPYLDHHRHLARFAAARRACAPTGIFGNSRAEIGFDPLSPAFLERGINAFNHAIPGSNANTAYRQLLWLEAGGCLPKQIVLGVEFFDFLGGAPAVTLPTLQTNPPPALDERFLAESVFSITGLRDSLTTLIAQRADFAPTITNLGFNPLRNYLQEVSRNGHHVLFRQRAEENLRNWSSRPKRLHPIEGGVSDDEMSVNAIIARSAASGSRIILVIYPYHAQIRLLLERMGLGELFSEWKRQVFRLAERHAGANVEVWDFSGISNETLEPIPAPGDRSSHLAYYWEAGHFKKELGDRLLARLTGREDSFGTRLEQQTLEAWLDRDRATVKSLLANSSPLAADVDQLVSRFQTAQ